MTIIGSTILSTSSVIVFIIILIRSIIYRSSTAGKQRENLVMHMGRSPGHQKPDVKERKQRVERLTQIESSCLSRPNWTDWQWFQLENWKRPHMLEKKARWVEEPNCRQEENPPQFTRQAKRTE